MMHGDEIKRIYKEDYHGEQGIVVLTVISVESTKQDS